MNLIKKLFRKKKYQSVVLAQDLPKKMLEERIIVVPNYNEKNVKGQKNG